MRRAPFALAASLVLGVTLSAQEPVRAGSSSRKADVRVFPEQCTALCDPDFGSLSVYSSTVNAKGAFVGATYDLVRRGPFWADVMGGAGTVQTRHRYVKPGTTPSAPGSRAG